MGHDLFFAPGAGPEAASVKVRILPPVNASGWGGAGGSTRQSRPPCRPQHPRGLPGPRTPAPAGPGQGRLCTRLHAGCQPSPHACLMMAERLGLPAGPCLAAVRGASMDASALRAACHRQGTHVPDSIGAWGIKVQGLSDHTPPLRHPVISNSCNPKIGINNSINRIRGACQHRTLDHTAPDGACTDAGDRQGRLRARCCMAGGVVRVVRVCMLGSGRPDAFR